MAKYKITYRCGHETITSLYGPTSGRNRQIAWMESQECWECEKAKAAEAGREIAQSVGLLDLSGSEKQVAWALQIRGSFLKKVQAAFLPGNHFGVARDAEFYQEMFWGALLNGDVLNATSAARHKALRAWQKENGLADAFSSMGFPKEHREELLAAAYSLILSWMAEAELAKWWIDCRDDLTEILGKECQEEWHSILKAVFSGGDAEEALAQMQAKAAAEAEAKEQEERESARLKAEAEAEAAIRVEGAKLHHLATIAAKEKQVVLAYPIKNEELRQLLRGKGFEWENARSQWQCTCQSAELAVELAAQIGHEVLALKIGVSIQDEDIRGKVLRGEYKKQPVGTITYQADTGKFSVWWKPWNDLFSQSKRLHGARWNKDKKVMEVPVASFEEVADFAQRENLFLSEGSHKAIAAQRQALALALEVPALTIPAPVIAEAPTSSKPGTPAPLEEPKVVEVPDSLRDEEEFGNPDTTFGNTVPTFGDFDPAYGDAQ